MKKRIITTKYELQCAVNLLNKRLGITDPTEKFFLQYAYGQPRLLKGVKGTSGNQDISPRLARGKLLKWIHADVRFAEIMSMGENK